uniref:Ketosynthase family 3 (KS3) domain-containing protein n=1 Tax=Rhodnius prolixus TaxID=13249 RepID=T1H832_RHOPR
MAGFSQLCSKPVTKGLLDVPNYLGKFKNNLTFDNKHFGIPNSLYQITDPLTTQSLKYSFEAICDAGVNPSSLTGTNTAVIMSSSISETEYEVLHNCNSRLSSMVGQSRNMQANRISYFLNFKGPSLVFNSSWTGGMQALQEAYQLVSSGQATAALAGAGNIIFGPEISFHFQSMGRLNKDGKTKSFSEDADGYTRSEGCVVFFLQRAEDAKRSYGTIVNVLTSNYGARSTSFSDFSPEQYKDLLLRIYKEAHIDPSEVCYIEADGTGIKKMDALELNAISEVMCKNRTTPLAIGSVKSNVGHSEVASTFISIIKVLFAFKTGYISPNLHYFSPNPEVPALLSGQMKVITEPTPLEGNTVGISGVGISGSYSHTIIKSPERKHLRQFSANNVPWLFVISGRVEPELVKVEAMPFKEEFIALTHNVFKSHIKGHLYRGYAILNEGDHKFHETKLYDVAEKRAIWFLFSGMGSQWPGMGADLMRLPTFARTINLCHEILLPKGINLLKIINSKDSHIYDNVLHSFIGIAAIQMGLVDVLREIGIEPDGIIGHSVGELGCAYADGCFTAKEMILSAFSRGKASIETQLVKGMMAAVGEVLCTLIINLFSIGLGYKQIKDQLPPSIEVACHNSDTSCTLSGPVDDMNEYVAGLKEKGIFAKLVNVSNIAYHSRYIKPAAPALLKYLQEVIQKPRKRTKRWISSSIPESSWDSDLAKFSSAEYHTNNLLNSVLFEEASAHIPENAIVIEIAPHGLLQSIVKKSLPNCTNIPLVNRFEIDTTLHLIKAIGKLYLEGISIKIDNLYPKVEFPVSGNLPYIAPMLTWDGTGSFQRIEGSFKKKPCWEYYKLSEKRLEKYLGCKIFDAEVMPSVSLLMHALDIFARSKEFSKNGNPLLIENIQFKQSLEIAKYNFKVFFNINTKILSCEGLTLHSPILKHCTITHSAPNLIKEICQFMPYYNSSAEKYQGQFVDCFQIVFHHIEWFKCITKRLIVILIKEDEDFKNMLSTYSSHNNINIDFITSPTKDSVDELHLNLKSWEHLLIIGELPPYESVLNCLKKVKTGFILQKENKNKNEKLKDFLPIFQFKYKEQFCTLFKMIYEEKFDLNIIKINTSNNWKANLKLYLKNNVSRIKSSNVQYVVGKIKTLSTVYNIVQFCKKLGTSEMIRFIFTDDESPSFSLDLPFYQQQIALDLIMNISVRGRWGYLKLLSLPNKPLMYPVNTEQKLIFPLSSIKGEDVKLTTLGINLSEIEENSQENQISSSYASVFQLVIFDYCGLDKLGREVCGIGTLSHTMKLIDDKLLCWQKPQHWTNEEAVSVPLCYLIAYSIYEHVYSTCSYELASKSTILVHRATLLASQAIIYVALSKGIEVFVTYTTLEEKNLILQFFPQIDKNNIFPRKNGIFVSLLLNKIKRGVDVVINSDEDRLMLDSSLQCIARHGIFFQMNNHTINESCAIGMKVFLKEIRVIGVSAESLLDRPFSVKEELHRRVQLDIKEGHVKPLRTNILPYNADNVDAVERAKNENSAKLVFSMFCNKPESIKKDLFICSERKSYIIISNEYKFWLDLVGWLLNRGALNVHVFRDLQNITQRNKQRIMSILNKYPSAKISLHPISNPTNFSEMKKYFVTINCIAEISEIFILGKVLRFDIEMNVTCQSAILILTRLIKR